MSSGLNKTISSNKPIYTGPYVGVEVELEGFKGQLINTPAYWDSVTDYSLRKGIEFVSSPTKPENIERRLKELYTECARANLKPTSRCGVHVHLNAQDLTLCNIISLSVLYSLFEPYIFKAFAAERENNHFCVPQYVNIPLVTSLASAFQEARSGQRRLLSTLKTTQKYCALNYATLNTLGTLEFRHLEATMDYTKVYRWVRFILSLREQALLYEDPEEIIISYEKYGIHTLKSKLTHKLYMTVDDDAKEAALDVAYILCGSDPVSWEELTWEAV